MRGIFFAKACFCLAYTRLAKEVLCEWRLFKQENVRSPRISFAMLGFLVKNGYLQRISSVMLDFLIQNWYLQRISFVIRLFELWKGHNSKDLLCEPLFWHASKMDQTGYSLRFLVRSWQTVIEIVDDSFFLWSVCRYICANETVFLYDLDACFRSFSQICGSFPISS